jgi:hypothetical protein
MMEAVYTSKKERDYTVLHSTRLSSSTDDDILHFSEHVNVGEKFLTWPKVHKGTVLLHPEQCRTIEILQTSC